MKWSSTRLHSSEVPQIDLKLIFIHNKIVDGMVATEDIRLQIFSNIISRWKNCLSSTWNPLWHVTMVYYVKLIAKAWIDILSQPTMSFWNRLLTCPWLTVWCKLAVKVKSIGALHHCYNMWYFSGWETSQFIKLWREDCYWYIFSVNITQDGFKLHVYHWGLRVPLAQLHL